jgi:serine protease Do
MSARRIGLWLLTLAVGTGLGAAAITWSQPVVPGLAVPPARTPDDLSLAFRDVAGRVLPAVVWIETHATAHREMARQGQEGEQEGEEQGEQDGAPNPGEDLFRRFFGDDPRFKNFQFPNVPQVPTEGHGSGFIIDASGIIMTNSHVVEGADKLIVHFHDGSEQRAESWVSDPRSDVAIIRIKTDGGLPVLPLGNSELMQVGDWVLAAGNPFDVGVTVTAGIISATGRGPGINERENYLQTDAAINPVNSGGPLVNLNGEVVGINTAISTSSGGYDGVGFAIPVNMARWVADQLIKDGTVRRAYLGVALDELTNDLRKAFDVPLGKGALVIQVGPDTPAQRAGLQAGDIILEMAGQTINDRGHLQGIVEALDVDKEYEMVVLREGAKQTINITVAQMPENYTAAMRRGRSPSAPDAPEEEKKPAPEFDSLGLQVQEVDADLRKQLQLGDKVEGIVVTAVKEGSPAATAGMQSGDIIEKVGSANVSTPDEFHAAVEKISLDKGVALLITRGAASRFIVLKSE